ncbi:SDR family oxidoreductase [Microlunatus antarcticus]|uniref:NADP-dependent 3-hydroxy acid dehydrogenase YdfG n=1 Tax=Microlunatus antarcticus TaxID=53388 RepID=A0A7W5JXE3_9ACTN|nr:SDR family NAD(P)-dependent oxidoreductase [Microlunatus antarcticus]MBB3327851.1 NADP-dependent 3-hydroxy acid dehydrogenase YdfG [Microlunatus antarcticus]
MDIDDAVVVVTGASSGIGEATARAASARGARVVLAARREDRVSALADELGRAVAVRCDVTDRAQVDALVRTAVDAFGRVDVVVNNAGQGLEARMEETDLDDFRALLELNVVAPLSVMQAVLPLMRAQGSGSIVNVSSGTTFADLPGTGAYVASKIALERLSAIARSELDGTGVTVSTVIPFITSTEFIGSMRAGRESAETSLAGLDFDPPERVAEVILDLVRTGAARADLVPVAYGGSRT